MGFFHRKSKIPKLSPSQKEHRAIRDMESNANDIRKKAYDEYRPGKKSYSQIKRKVARSERIRRGF